MDKYGVIEMSESVIREITEKLDKIQEDMTEVKVKIAKIETTLENQPVLDEALRSKLEQKIDNNEKRLNSVEAWGKWVIIAVLGVVINAIMQHVLHQG